MVVVRSVSVCVCVCLSEELCLLSEWEKASRGCSFYAFEGGQEELASLRRLRSTLCFRTKYSAEEHPPLLQVDCRLAKDNIR